MWKKVSSKAKKDTRDLNGLGDVAEFVRDNQLPAARSVLNNLLPVEGFSCIEVFSGGACLTLALVRCLLPCMGPWKILLGASLDVLKFGWVLVQLARQKKIRFSHLGTPCQSMTLARQSFLRSRTELFGNSHLSKAQKALVLLGNRLAIWSVIFAIELYKPGSYFGD